MQPGNELRHLQATQGQRFITTEEFINKGEVLFNMAREELKGSTGMTPTIWAAYRTSAEDDLTIEATLLLLDDFYENRRQAVIQAAQNSFEVGKMLCAVWFASEAWTSKSPKKYPNFADDPDREEVLIMFARTIDQRGNVRQSAFHKNKRGIVVKIDEAIVQSDCQKIQSSLINLFFDVYARRAVLSMLTGK